MSEVDSAKIEDLIERSSRSGGSEIANFQTFVHDLCEALALPRPDYAGQENALNNYVFERRVDFKHPNGTTSQGRIDLYKRG